MAKSNHTVCFSTLALTVLVSTHSSASGIVSYKTIYELEIAKPFISSIERPRGVYSYTQKENCHQWELSFFMKLRLRPNKPSEQVIETSWRVAELKSGKHMAFETIGPNDAGLIETIAGTARLSEDRGNGIATFTSPNPAKHELLKGTVFPMVSIRNSLASLKAQKRFTRHLVFSGSEFKGSVKVTEQILGKPSNRRLVAFDNSLRSYRSWRTISHSFDGPDNQAMIAVKQQGTVYANGIVDIETISGRGVEYRLTPVDFALLPKPSCPEN